MGGWVGGWVGGCECVSETFSRSSDIYFYSAIYVYFLFTTLMYTSSIYIIIRDCTRVGAFPRAFCVPNSVALASLTLQVVYWAIH